MTPISNIIKEPQLSPPLRPPQSLVIACGDPAGIGPELIAAAWEARVAEKLPPFVVIGNGEILQAAALSRGINLPIAPISNLSEGAALFAEQLPVLPLGSPSPSLDPSLDPSLSPSPSLDPSLSPSHSLNPGLNPNLSPSPTESPTVSPTYSPGAPNKDGAMAALQSLKMAVNFAIAGEASALVTAPVSKQALAEIGFTFPGQTEFLGRSCGTAPEDAVMMLAGPSLRSVPLTVHCALSEVPSRITGHLIESRARKVAAALTRDFGITNPRLAIAGLNPHAGENGAFGREEIEIITPAIAALQEAGINASGPFAADALFAPHNRDHYDAALCMYHDQALIPIKALDFDAGVNVTLGLPIIRTSPDHGTAFDIAGKNLADPGAMIAAIRMAGECAQMRAEQSRNG